MDLIQWLSIFSAFIHIYIVYGMDPAQLLHVVVKQAVNCILDLLGHKPKDSFSHYAAHIPVFTVKLHVLGPPACFISLITLQRV